MSSGLSTIVEIIRAYQPSIPTPTSFLSTIVEIIRAYQPVTIGTKKANHLQQQKLLELTSHKIDYETPEGSTIVEIIRTYQPFANVKQNIVIYNSRNYQSLLAVFSMSSFLISTIVEIIRAYQPPHGPQVAFSIYNSRNYQSLLAIIMYDFRPHRSTIVEIIRAYQPCLSYVCAI